MNKKPELMLVELSEKELETISGGAQKVNQGNGINVGVNAKVNDVNVNVLSEQNR